MLQGSATEEQLQLDQYDTNVFSSGPIRVRVRVKKTVKNIIFV